MSTARCTAAVVETSSVESAAGATGDRVASPEQSDRDVGPKPSCWFWKRASLRSLNPSAGLRLNALATSRNEHASLAYVTVLSSCPAAHESCTTFIQGCQQLIQVAFCIQVGHAQRQPVRFGEQQYHVRNEAKPNLLVVGPSSALEPPYSMCVSCTAMTAPASPPRSIVEVRCGLRISDALDASLLMKRWSASKAASEPIALKGLRWLCLELSSDDSEAFRTDHLPLPRQLPSCFGGACA